MRKAPFRHAAAQLLLQHQLPKPHARRTDTFKVLAHLFASPFAAARSGQAFLVGGLFSFDSLSGLRAGGWPHLSLCARALRQHRAYLRKDLNELCLTSLVVHATAARIVCDLLRCPLPTSRLLLHRGSSRGRGVCVGGGPLPATCLMGGGRGFFGVFAKVCAAPQGARTRALPARLPPSLLLNPAVATLSGASTDAAGSTGGCGPTRRMVGATADTTAALCSLAAARCRPFAALTAACQKRSPGSPPRLCV